MFKNALLLILLSLPVFPLAGEKEDIGLIITNYSYDQWGRPVRTSSHTNSYYNRGYTNPYTNPAFTPYYPSSLPGSDPNRMDDIFEQNVRKR